MPSLKELFTDVISSEEIFLIVAQIRGEKKTSQQGILYNYFTDKNLRRLLRIGPATLFIRDLLNYVDSPLKIQVYIPLNFVRLDFNLGSRIAFLLDLSVRNT